MCRDSAQPDAMPVHRKRSSFLLRLFPPQRSAWPQRDCMRKSEVFTAKETKASYLLSAAQAKLRHQRQMVRRHQGHAAAMQNKLFQRQLAVKIHVVQMHDG